MIWDWLLGKYKFDENKDYDTKYIIEVKNFGLKTAGSHILHNVNIKFRENAVTAIIGPSGSGKSTLLRSINRTNFGKDAYSHEGEILYRGNNILDKDCPPSYIRTQIGTVLQKPVMFPMTIKENITFALKAHGMRCWDRLEIIVERVLREAHLWDEVKDRLNSRPEETLSIGQQQRLCIARAISLDPQVLLMDEPTSALDPKSSSKIEELIRNIAKNKRSTIILVSHSLSQVRRVSDYTVFIKNGVIVEQGRTKDIFTKPLHRDTKEFISAR